jgi:hypothetical protein
MCIGWCRQSVSSANQTMKAVLAYLTVGVVTALSSTPALADLLIYEPFDYPAGGAVIGQTDTYSPGSPTWARAGTAGTTVQQVASPSLTSPSGFPASVGNAGSMMNADSTEYARMSLGAQYGANTSTYYSLLLDVPSIAGLTTAHSNANAANDGIIAFNNSTGAGARPTIFGAMLTMRLGSVANTFNLGMRASTTAGGTTYWSADLTPGQTYLVVGDYAIGATPGSGGVNSLWLDPSSATFGAAFAPTADGSSIGDLNATGSNDHIDSLVIGAGVAAGADPTQTLIDEIRVGTTWADVTSVAVPEPSTLAVAGFGALALASRFRARRR